MATTTHNTRKATSNTATSAPTAAPQAPSAELVATVQAPAPFVTPAPVVTPTEVSAPTAAPAPQAAPVLTGNMHATLAYLAAQSGPVTHNALALHTGRSKGNKLRNLLAYGYTHTAVAPAGVRGYVYSITLAGRAALAALPPAPVAAPVVPASPPVPVAALLAGFGLDTPAVVPAPQAPAVEPSEATKPARKPRK